MNDKRNTKTLTDYNPHFYFMMVQCSFSWSETNKIQFNLKSNEHKEEHAEDEYQRATCRLKHWAESCETCRNMWTEEICSFIQTSIKEAASFPDRKCCWSSTLSSGQGPGFEWRGSVHSDWPRSSLSPPSSTGLQRGSGCCSSCSGRHSPGPPGCVTPLRSCCCPPPSSPASRLRGSPRWPHTPLWHCPAAAPLWRGGGRSGWAASPPLEERERGGRRGGREDRGMRVKAW